MDTMLTRMRWPNDVTKIILRQLEPIISLVNCHGAFPLGTPITCPHDKIVVEHQLTVEKAKALRECGFGFHRLITLEWMFKNTESVPGRAPYTRILRANVLDFPIWCVFPQPKQHPVYMREYAFIDPFDFQLTHKLNMSSHVKLYPDNVIEFDGICFYVGTHARVTLRQLGEKSRRGYRWPILVNPETLDADKSATLLVSIANSTYEHEYLATGLAHARDIMLKWAASAFARIDILGRRYPGAYVYPAINHSSRYDFSSMYPSIMRTHNITFGSRAEFEIPRDGDLKLLDHQKMAMAIMGGVSYGSRSMPQVFMSATPMSSSDEDVKSVMSLVTAGRHAWHNIKQVVGRAVRTTSHEKMAPPLSFTNPVREIIVMVRPTSQSADSPAVGLVKNYTWPLNITSGGAYGSHNQIVADDDYTTQPPAFVPHSEHAHDRAIASHARWMHKPQRQHRQRQLRAERKAAKRQQRNNIPNKPTSHKRSYR